MTQKLVALPCHCIQNLHVFPIDEEVKQKKLTNVAKRICDTISWRSESNLYSLYQQYTSYVSDSEFDGECNITSSLGR